MPGEEGFDLRRHRLPLLAVVYLFLAAVVYHYLVDLLVFTSLLVGIWFAYDFIRDFTKTKVDPTGKYVFITGCDSGFGLAAAKAIRDLGFGVIAGCYDDSSAGAVELKSRPWVQKVEVLSLDVTNQASVQACAREVQEICQEQGLWAVINNAGINGMGPVELVSMEMYHRISEVNLFGPIRVIKSVLPLLRQAQGRIINCSSERGYNPWKGSSSYCLTKFGLECFTECLRREMAQFNVKVISVAPGHFAAATSILNQKMNSTIVDQLMSAREKLSLQDQDKAYSKEAVESVAKSLSVEELHKSSPSSQPIVAAYIDAVHNTDPLRRYFVHGMKRQFLDPFIVMARIRPFVPDKVVEYVEKVVLAVLY